MADLYLQSTACANMFFTSFVDAPSVICVDPKYLNWSSCSSISPFIRWPWLDAVTEDFAFVAADFHFAFSFVSYWSSSSLSPRRLMSSTNPRLQSDRPLTDTEVSQYFALSFPGVPILNSIGENGYPCSNSIVVRKKSPIFPSNANALHRTTT